MNRSDFFLAQALALRCAIRFYNGMARIYPENSGRYKAEAKRSLKRAKFYLGEARLEQGRMRPETLAVVARLNADLILSEAAE